MFGAFGSWLAANKWARDIGIFIGMCLALLAGERLYRWNVESGVKRRMNDKHAREQAEELARVSETRREISQENQNAAIKADEAARNSPRFPDYNKLRNADPTGASELFGDRPAGSDRTETR